MTEDKKKIDWQEVDLRELFEDAPIDLHDHDPEKGMFEFVLEKYMEKNSTLNILHSNFNLSLKILKRLAIVDGVEAVIPLGRYKAIIMFGKLFECDEVKQSVQKEINKLLFPKDLKKISEQ